MIARIPCASIVAFEARADGFQESDSKLFVFEAFVLGQKLR